MAGSAQRQEPLPQPPARSAERDRLAQACAEHQATTDRLARLRQGLDQARRDSTGAFAAVERAEEAVKVAAREEPRRTAAEAIGEVYEGTGPSLEVAERNLARAQGSHPHHHKVAEVLAKEVAAAQERVAQTQAAVTAAVVAVIAPGLDRMFAEYVAALAWSAALADAFRVVGPARFPRSLQYWDRTNHELPAVEEPLPVTLWREYLAHLEAGEVDTPPPAIG